MLNYSAIFDEGMTYSVYREVVYLRLQDGKTTGEDHSPEMLHYTKMNNHRMNRIEKETYLNKDLSTVISTIKGKYNFLVISEGWCGDAAQILPVFDKIVEESRGKFNMRVVLRDENLELIDSHLTNGGRAIPVLLVLDENKNPILPKWGPRPQVFQTLLKQWKAENDDAYAVAEQLHRWYAKDKTQTTQAELVELLKQLD
ncbi:thioredoxin family protein [Pedobacter sp. LMG 31464]|uniref:Thioredoxin family protein n=1 Tax=Pedobacter planticolens TaxID=2679964 RepID=A0A923E1Y1_9SPHI|nr:thioredoxin family protein [Pedobacter planticolens]MBB2146568.1 thioredoxin family protein [Pedobacter planticolens]